jgi:hypothetical protein
MKKSIHLLFIIMTVLQLSVKSQAQTINSEKEVVKTSTNKNVKTRSAQTEYWLQDLTTISFGGPETERNYFRNSFNGIRLLFEPQFGHVFQTVNNRVEPNDYNSLVKFGFETNLFMGNVALQCLIIFPATVQMDNSSMIRANQHIIDPTGRVAVDYGLGVGLSFFNGILALGFAGIFFDERGFTNMNDISRQTFNYQTNFVYFAIQPVSGIKSVIQNLREVSKR